MRHYDSYFMTQIESKMSNRGNPRYANSFVQGSGIIPSYNLARYDSYNSNDDS